MSNKFSEAAVIRNKVDCPGMNCSCAMCWRLTIRSWRVTDCTVLGTSPSHECMESHCLNRGYFEGALAEKIKFWILLFCGGRTKGIDLGIRCCSFRKRLLASLKVKGRVWRRI
jgi:hypothetical protein